MVCGLMEQKAISMQQPETMTALKSVNDFFCTPLSSSSQSLGSFGNLNKHLERPPMEGGVRSVLVCFLSAVNQIKMWKKNYRLCSHGNLIRPLFFCFLSDAVLQKWGRVAANFTRDQWICLSFLMKEFGSCESVKTSPDTLKAALSCSMEALTLLPGDLVLPVLTYLETLLPQVSQHWCVHQDLNFFQFQFYLSHHSTWQWNVDVAETKVQ